MKTHDLVCVNYYPGEFLVNRSLTTFRFRVFGIFGVSLVAKLRFLAQVFSGTAALAP